MGRERGEILQKAFGSRQNVGLNAFFRQLETGEKVNGVLYQGAELVKLYLDRVKNAEGESRRFEEAMEGTYDGLMKFISAAQQVVRIQIGEALMNAVRPLLQVVLPVLRAIGETLEAMPAHVKTVIAQIVLLGAVGTTVALGLGAVLAGVVATLVVIGPEVFALGLVASAAFAGLAAGAALVGAALYAVFGNDLNDFASGITKFIADAKLSFAVLGQLIKQGGTSGEVNDRIMNPMNRGLLDFLMGVWLWMNRIKNFATSMWDGFKEALREMSGPMEGLMDTFDQLLGMFGVSAGTVKSNEQAYRDWGEAGRALGGTLATLANVGMVLITGAIKALMLLMDAAHQMMENFGYTGPLGLKKFANDAKFYGQAFTAHPLDAMETARHGKVLDLESQWIKEHPNGQGSMDERRRFATLNAMNPLVAKEFLEMEPTDITPHIQGPSSVAASVPAMGTNHPGVAAAEAIQTVVLNKSRVPQAGDMVFYNTFKVGEEIIHSQMSRIAAGDANRSGLPWDGMGR